MRQSSKVEEGKYNIDLETDPYYFMLTMFHLFIVMFIHASLRLRNLKNKMENKLEGIGLKKTPMGIILDALEQQEESISKITDYITKVKE